MSDCACIFNIITVMYLCKLSGNVPEPLLLIINQCKSRKRERDYAPGWTSGESAFDYWQGRGLLILRSIPSVSETNGL